MPPSADGAPAAARPPCSMSEPVEPLLTPFFTLRCRPQSPAEIARQREIEADAVPGLARDQDPAARLDSQRVGDIVGVELGDDPPVLSESGVEKTSLRVA